MFAFILTASPGSQRFSIRAPLSCATLTAGVIREKGQGTSCRFSD
jgi:hypothetical protein